MLLSRGDGQNRNREITADDHEVIGRHDMPIVFQRILRLIQKFVQRNWRAFVSEKTAHGLYLVKDIGVIFNFFDFVI